MNNNISFSKLFVINVFIPLIIGVTIYILFRSNSLIMFDWFGKIELVNKIDEYRKYIAPLKNNIPNWLLFSLPDGLWCYSFVSAYLIADKKINLWLSIPLLCGLGIEILQYFHLFKGTYDVIDTLFYTLGFSLPFITLNKIIKSTNIQTTENAKKN